MYMYKVSTIPLSHSPVPLACLQGGCIDIVGCCVIIYINQLIGIGEDAVILIGRGRAGASSNAAASALATDESLGALRIAVTISLTELQRRGSRTAGDNIISRYRRAVVIVDIFQLGKGLHRRTLGGGVGDCRGLRWGLGRRRRNMAVVLPGDTTTGAPIHCRRTSSLVTHEADVTIVVVIALNEKEVWDRIKGKPIHTYCKSAHEVEEFVTRHQRFLSHSPVPLACL